MPIGYLLAAWIVYTLVVKLTHVMRYRGKFQTRPTIPLEEKNTYRQYIFYDSSENEKFPVDFDTPRSSDSVR